MATATHMNSGLTTAGVDAPDTPASSLMRWKHQVDRRYQTFLDVTTPHTGIRWGVFGLLLLTFMLRIFITHGWYIICYALGIYLLSLFLLFLQPKFDPAVTAVLEGDDDIMADSTPVLPTRNDAEFRPFIRRLPEFKFWVSATRATLIALVCTLFDALDIPVFWPILLIYFIFLAAVTMRRQIRHMIKYRYVPFNIGKKNYGKASPSSAPSRNGRSD
ncbi:retrieval of early ER protein Rer1 [Syncephalis plumigaleata]|nr:retrieval of early ER protein Rer1 [Syncephalis plumigaleata]